MNDVVQKVGFAICASDHRQLGGVGQGRSMFDNGGGFPAPRVARDSHEVIVAVGIVQLGIGALVGDRHRRFRLGISGVFDLVGWRVGSAGLIRRAWRGGFIRLPPGIFTKLREFRAPW